MLLHPPFVAIACFLLAIDRSHLELPDAANWTAFEKSLHALREPSAAPIVTQLTDAGVCDNETGLWTGLTKSGDVTWNGSLTGRPTEQELVEFWQLLRLVEKSISPPVQWNASGLELIRLNRTRPNGTLNNGNGTKSSVWVRLPGKSFLRWLDQQSVQIEQESGRDEGTLLKGLVVGVGTVIGVSLLVLLGLFLVLLVVHKCRADEVHFDWGAYEFHPQAAGYGGAYGYEGALLGIRPVYSLRTRRGGGGAGERPRRSPNQKQQQSHFPEDPVRLDETDVHTEPEAPQEAATKPNPDVKPALLQARDSQW